MGSTRCNSTLLGIKGSLLYDGRHQMKMKNSGFRLEAILSSSPLSTCQIKNGKVIEITIENEL
jgi:hypothetical protein